MSFTPPNTSGTEQRPLIPQRGQRNVMIDDDLVDPVPRPRSNPTFEASRRFPNETQDDMLPSNFPGPSTMFQRAREVDIGGNPSFVNGTLQNVYYYNNYNDNHVTSNLTRTSIKFAARQNERRADIINKLGEEVKEQNQRLQRKIEELSRVEDTANRQEEKLKRLKGEVGKLNQLLQEKNGELIRMEKASNRQAEKLKRLEEEVEKLNQLLHEKTQELSRVEDAANQQNAKQAEDLKQSSAEVGKLNRLLHEKTEELSRMEETANRQNAKQAEDLKQSNAEVGKLTQLLQEKTEELSRVEDASNRQAEKLKRLEEEVGKLNQLLQEKMAELASLGEAANRQNAKQAEDLKRSNVEVGRLNRLLQEMTDERSRVEGASNLQAMKLKQSEREVAKLHQVLKEKTEELASVEEAANRDKLDENKIRILEENVSGMIADMKQQKEKYEEENRSLQAKVYNLVEEKNQLKAKYEEEIRDFRVNIHNQKANGLNQELEIEKPQKTHEQEVERLEGKHDIKEIQRLEAIVANMGKQTWKEIECLQPKISSEEGAKHLKTKQARHHTKNPDKKPIDASQPPQTQVTKHSSTVANQKIDGSDQEPGIKKELNKSLPRTSASGKQRDIPPPQAGAHKADILSATDVANFVKALNAEIGQLVIILTESLPEPGPPASDIAFDELRNYLGPWLCDKLQENSEPDSWIAELALQTGLANACSSVVNDPPFWCDGSILQTLYIRMGEKESEAAADKWRTKASIYLDLLQFEDANKKYLTEVLLKLATAVVGGTLKSNEGLLSQYNPQVEVIAKMAAKLHKTITEDVTSSELITFIVPCDTEFDASQMEDTENNHGSTPHGKIFCTHDMGLLCRKRVERKKPRGSLKDWGMTMKAKVVLATTLEG